MTQIVDKVRSQDGVESDLSTRQPVMTGRVVLSILVGAAVGLTLIGLVNRPDATAGAITAESYRLYTQAMTETQSQTPTPGAITAESYRLYTQAMTETQSQTLTPGAITAESYRSFAEAMREPQSQTPTPGATTAESYRRFAEAMRELSESGD